MDEKHTENSILGLARGFTKSRVFITAAELDLFTLLASDRLTAEQVSAAKNANLHGMSILLDALTALGYFVKKDGCYQTEPSVVAFLSAKSPDSILPMVRYSIDLWKRWSKLTDIVLGHAEPEKENTDADETLQTLVKAMHVVNCQKAPQVIKNINPGNARKLLDVGGGAGTYTLAFLHEVPHLQATLFDFPSIVTIAQDYFQQAGMGERARCVAGDYLNDDLPEGYDIALLSAVIHQHSSEENGILYNKVYQALNPGGRIVIRGFVMSEEKTEPREGAIFAVNMLTSSQGGKTYSFSEIKQDLEKAGFSNVGLINNDGFFSLVDAIKDPDQNNIGIPVF